MAEERGGEGVLPALYTAQGERPDYRFKTTLSHRLRRCQLPYREHIKVRRICEG